MPRFDPPGRPWPPLRRPPRAADSRRCPKLIDKAEPRAAGPGVEARPGAVGAVQLHHRRHRDPRRPGQRGRRSPSRGVRQGSRALRQRPASRRPAPQDQAAQARAHAAGAQRPREDRRADPPRGLARRASTASGKYCPPGRRVHRPRRARRTSWPPSRDPEGAARGLDRLARHRAADARRLRSASSSSPTRARASSASRTSARCGAPSTTCRPTTSPRSSTAVEQVRPLYVSLHAYVRARLREVRRPAVPPDKPIPAHLLGNMWAQSGTTSTRLVAPPKRRPRLRPDRAS